MAVKDWSTTAGSNTGILSGLTLDGAVMTPPQVDNAFREMAAQIASQLGKLGFKGADIASSGTTNLATATGWYLDITGTTTITAFGTVDAGQGFLLRFTGALTLTHNATSLILPGGASFTTAAGDVAFMMSLGSGNWRCVSYQAAAAVSTVITPPTVQVFTGNATWTKPTGCTRIIAEGVGGGGGSGGILGLSNGGGSSGGAGSGFYGEVLIDVSAVASGAVVIGAGGTAGSGTPTSGGNGGNSTLTIGATTYTWGGGGSSPGYISNFAVSAGSQGGNGGVGTNVIGGSNNGQMGRNSCNTAPGSGNADGGDGASSPFGRGGIARHTITADTGAGAAGSGFGAGGGGGANGGTAANATGAVGSAGYLRIWEYYS